MSVSYQERRARGLWQDTLIEHPFSSLDGSHLVKPLYVDLMNTAPIQRLKKISQLNFLEDKSPDDSYKRPFSHNRFSHTIAVAALMEKVLQSNGFSEEDVITGVVAAFLHDAAMPAYGDTIKSLDPKALDEETHWQDIVNAKIRSLLKTHGVSFEKIDQIIQNQGVLGKLLDITDRIAYVAKDFHAVFLENLGFRFDALPPLRKIHEVTEKDKQWLLFYSKFIHRMGDIYKAIEVDRKSGQIFFTDLQLLRIFLYYRAHLHRYMYLHPHNIGRDLVATAILSPFYTPATDVFPFQDPSRLTPQKLRRMTDFDLRDLILDHGTSWQKIMYIYLTIHNSWAPEYERFHTMEEATVREHELQKDKGIQVIGKRTIQGFQTGIDYLVKTPTGITQFKDADSKGALLIQDEAAHTKGTYLFFTKKRIVHQK